MYYVMYYTLRIICVFVLYMLCYVIMYVCLCYVMYYVLCIMSLWCSSSIQGAELSNPGLFLVHGSHCVTEVGEMCRLMVVVTSGRLVH